MRSHHLFSILFLSIVTLINGRELNRAPKPTAAARVLYQFPNLTSLENIAARSNGHLLVTPLTSSSLYSLDPSFPKVANLVHTFPNATSLLGITEYEPDVFALVSGADPEDPSIPWVIWSIDFNQCLKGTKTPLVRKIATLPKALFLNGLTNLAPGSPWILAADSQLGLVWRINVKTGAVNVAISDPLMAPVTEFGIALGVNGVHIFQSHLYFTNIFLQGGFFAKIPIDPRTGEALGKATIVARNGLCDDFVIDSKGDAWVTQNLLNGVQVIKPNGSVRVAIGGVNDTIVEGVTGAVFGRTLKDRNVLYVSTNGGSAVPVPGTFRVGGTVVAVDTNLL
jgi:hypothetical protein